MGSAHMQNHNLMLTDTKKHRYIAHIVCGVWQLYIGYHDQSAKKILEHSRVSIHGHTIPLFVSKYESDDARYLDESIVHCSTICTALLCALQIVNYLDILLIEGVPTQSYSKAVK